jgi:hypothetical protein
MGINLQAQLEKGTTNLQLGGGWNSIGIVSAPDNASGFIINGMVETWLASQVGIGGSFHYIRGSAEHENEATGKATSLPFFFNGKYYIGKNKFKVFAMGSFGLQFSSRKLEGEAETGGTDHDWGLAYGGGAGMAYTPGPKILISLNYSLYALRNAYYADAVVNAITLNLGYILFNQR